METDDEYSTDETGRRALKVAQAGFERSKKPQRSPVKSQQDENKFEFILEMMYEIKMNPKADREDTQQISKRPCN